MPARNTVKIYIESSYYHLYNRGVEGREIFTDDGDYKMFLSFIKKYLAPTVQNQVQPQWKIDLPVNLQLAAYCLMPNHFHLLVKQFSKNSTTIFMRALMNSYVHYFNEKNKRIGGLFQGIFKAVLIETESHLLHLTRYIHLNPLELPDMNLRKIEDYYCSYGEYLGKRNTPWVNSKEILGYFGSKLIGMESFKSYRDFVEKYQGDSSKVLGKLILE